MPPAKSITLYLDFHTFTVKYLSQYGQRQYALMSTILSADWLTTGYPLAIMVTRLQKKINKWCSFSVFRFFITADAVFNPYVLVS